MIKQNKKTEKTKLLVGVSDGMADSFSNFLKTFGDITFITFSDIVKRKYQDNLDLLLFGGGADVSPEYYGELKGKYTNNNPERDKLENIISSHYYRMPKLGICRGSQFLSAMAGAKLIQHVEEHCQNHNISTNDGRVYNITSTHHQMMFPFNLDANKYKLIAWSTKFQSNTYLNDIDKEKELPQNFLEPEIVFYKEYNSLCIQGHPEFANCPKDTINYICTLIYIYLLKKTQHDIKF